MWLNNHHWHFDYVRLAKDTGFSFEKTKSPLDKNKMCMIDVDRIVAEGDVGIVEQFLPTIIQYNIETGEHVGILDQNFLKLFRMSQLAVEYILFCKKYLDHTVTLLKEEVKATKLENKELKAFNDELKQHTDVLLAKLKTKQDLVCTFKCTKCSKAFSSEEYLAAHCERRHSINKEVGNCGVDIEMEIKEIKQKLNNTEKLMKNEEFSPKLEDTLNKNYSKVSELLVKFESLKSQVESDFKVLQTQKDFEEKYSKIFQSALENVKNQVNKELGVNLPYRFSEKRNSVTQTDINEVEKFEKTVQVEDFPNTRQTKLEHMCEERRLLSIEEEVKRACESISNTMGSSLKNMEVQMNALWDQLQQLELKKSVVPSPDLEDIEDNKMKQPKTKIRRRFSRNLENVLMVSTEPEVVVEKSQIQEKTQRPASSQLSSKTRYDDLDRMDNVEDINPEPSRSVTVVKSANTMYETEESESDEEEGHPNSKSISDTSVEDKDYDEVQSQTRDDLFKGKSMLTLGGKSVSTLGGKSVSTLGERSITSLRKASLNSEVRTKLRVEMERVLKERFSNLGLSIEWKGIPQQTYTKTMDILKHQAKLMEKSYPDYNSIRKKLLKTVEDEVKKRGQIVKPTNVKKLKKYVTKQATSLKSFPKTSSTISVKKPRSAPQIEIKNRKMFESDSSTDEDPTPETKRIPSNVIRRTAPYSAVIEELKQTQKSDENLPKLGDAEKTLMVKSADLKMKDNNNEDNEKNDFQTKGVLKNFPSVRPVPKKRVFFDLKSDKSLDQKTFLKDVGGGSTTSVASSVLDFSDNESASHKISDGKKQTENVIEDLSDSDFSIFGSSDKKGTPT